jgi:non-ribosomal peptide synthetase-like protein
LGEIENALSLHAQIQTCAVILSSARSQLEAYIVAKNDVAAIDVKELRQTLAALPAYMQPAAYLFLKADEMPRLPSGKINAKALQDVSKANAEARSHAMEDLVEDDGDVDPSSELGVLLSALRHTFPDAVSIQPTSDFFDDLGGHSLAAATLVSYIRRTCPDSASALRSLSLQDIYLLKTAEAIIAKYKDTMRTSEEHEDEELLMYRAEKGDCVSAARSGGPSGVRTGEHWPVSQTRFVLCGVAQIPALIFIWFLQSIQFLLPYLCFVALRDLTHDVGFAILAAYGALVVTPVFLFFVALAGKWLVLGMAEPGEYPLYGVYYYRWWFSVRLLEMIDLGTLAETPIIATLWRLAGARIGMHCHIAGILMSCPDLVCIGDDVVLSAHVKLDTAYVERGRLILKPITIGSGARIGTNCLIEGGAVVEADAELVRMTMVPDGVRIPAAQRWHGSPATYLDEVKDVGLERRTRPSQVRFLLTGFLLSFLTVFVLPMVYLAPQIPILLLFEFVDIKHLSRAWAQIAIMALPGSMAYIAMVFIEMVALRWIVLGRVKEGTYSTTSLFFVRKWFVDRIMAISLLVLHAVYATLYVIPYLRALGVKIGDRAEVSTATGINFNLTEIGDESFVADRVYIGPVEVRANAFTLRRTTFEKRAFAGNSSIVPQGTTLHSETLVGVLSVAPDPDHGTPMKNGQSCFGSPPVLMPARQAAKVCHPDHKLFAPFRSQIALRLFIEGARIILPRVVVVFGIGFSMSIFQVAYPHIGIVRAAVMLPIYHLIMFCLPALAIVVACKWVLIGRYRPAEWPLWSNEVWRSEFVTSTYEALVAPTFTNKLVGTPYLAMCFRLLGVKIGKRVTLLHNDMTEYDMITLGDESVLNANSGCQTHLFEDRVMKIAYVTLGKRAVLKSYSICLPGSHVQEGGQVGSLSLVMKGETVPAGQAWEGAPIVPRPKRQRGAFSSPIYPKATKETGSPSHSAEVTELTRFTEHTNFTVSSFPKSSFTFASPVIASSATTQIDV